MKWLALLIALSAPAWAQMPPLPQDVPSPKTYRSADTMKGATKQLAMIAPAAVVPPRLITMAWCEKNLNVHAWEVWHSPNLWDWSLLAVVGELQYSKPMDEGREYFRVRGVADDGRKSGWATNEPCP